MWDRNVRPLEWLGIGATLLLAALTLWVASYPIVGTSALLFGSMGWSLVAITWSVGLAATVNDRLAFGASMLLLVGAAASIPFFGLTPLFVAITGPAGMAAMIAVGLALFAVVVFRSPVPRLAWLIAPVVVLAMLAIVFTGLPRLARMVVAEPELTQFAQSIQRGEGPSLPVYFDEPISVGTIPIYEAFVNSGHLHLVTAYVGILDDDGAGLAYLPSERPDSHPLYEHLLGPWYRWYPY